MSLAPPARGGEAIRLTSRADGFEFGAWRVATTDARRGGLVMLHALWGVTPHLRALAAEFAEDGYEVIVPSLFDRFEPGFASEDAEPSAEAVRVGYAEALGWGEGALPDVQACIDALTPPVMLLGFCFGGTTAWFAACRCDGLAAVACFYGGAIADHVEETPLRPTLLHFGREDELITLEEVARIAEAHPDLPIHLYDAGQAFMAPSDYRPDAARLAKLRTLQLFHRAAGRGEMGG